MPGSGIANSLILLVIGIAIFLICREIVCWYWKMNETVSILKEIRDLLKSLQPPTEPSINPEINPTIDPESNMSKPTESEIKRLRKLAGKDAIMFSYATDSEWVCTCGTNNPLDAANDFQKCSNCGLGKNYVLKNCTKNS